MTSQVQFIVDGQNEVVVLRNVPIPEKGSQIQLRETLYDVCEVAVVYASIAGEDIFVDVHLSPHKEPNP